MKLTDEQIQHIESLMKGAIFKDTKIAGHILQLLADHQAWKEEAERLQTQLNQAVEVLKKAEKFIDAILSFYGQNLMVFNWHQNEDGEPWDNFFDDNMDGDELEIIQNFLSSLSERGNHE